LNDRKALITAIGKQKKSLFLDSAVAYSTSAKMAGNSPAVFLNTYASHVRAEDEDKLVNGVSSEFGRVCEIENKKKPA
jgi:hypothetical protein